MLIVDFDDTLVDMTPERWAFFEATLRSHGATDDDLAVMNRLKGGGFIALVKAALPDVDVPSFIATYAYGLDVKRIRLCRGAKDLLSWAAAAHVPVIVLSSSSRILVERDLELAGLADLVTAVLGCEDVPATKPDPRSVRAVLDHPVLAFRDPNSVLFVGDSLADAVASRGQIPFVAVLSGSTSAAEFDSAGVASTAVVESLTDLVERFTAAGGPSRS